MIEEEGVCFEKKIKKEKKKKKDFEIEKLKKKKKKRKRKGNCERGIKIEKEKEKRFCIYKRKIIFFDSQKKKTKQITQSIWKFF
jgi:hypothetical protein